jgi:hypothetical protein
LYRFSLRITAAAGLRRPLEVRSRTWLLGGFVRDELPEAASAVVLVGTAGPAQKITVQVRDGGREVLGYLKYAEKEAARRRLAQEREMLANLPAGMAPKPLKFGELGDGEALLVTAMEGRALPTVLPPPEDLADLSAVLLHDTRVPLEVHPWVLSVRDHTGVRLDPWLEVLADRDWPIAVQHGDFAPWNLLRRPDGTLGAIDWEYGTREGFPYLDLAYYVLQTLALIYRQPPLKAAEYATGYLTRQPPLALDSGEARALVRLAAYDAHRKSREDGQPDAARLQTWRRAIWAPGA